MIELLHHGATKGVTGSCHELRLGEDGLLIDCGLLQGADIRGSDPEGHIDFDIGHIRALVVTHVHIDHVGRIPYLLAAGFKGPILCSQPSALLLPAVLEDALKIGFTRNRRLIERVLDLIRSRLQPLPYNQWHTLALETPGHALDIRLQRAGHILGSAYVECQARTPDTDERILFSGDLGAPDAPLLPPPEPPERADRLVLESTYGDRNHEHRAQRQQRLQAILNHALEDGGTLLIPAFSIGRTQDLLYELEAIIQAGQQELEVVVDSPLAANFTALYRQLQPFWDREARARLAAGRHPLAFEQLTVIDSHADHLRTVDYLARSHRPCVVLAGSGMCAGGRVVNYLKALLHEPRNDVLFVGYQAAGTPGRDILQYGPRNGWVELDGKRYDIHAQVHQIGGYSAHAGQDDLLEFVRALPVPPAEIRLVHGDSRAKQALAQRLRLQGAPRVHIPA
ncbi:MBL fold metallo-hydrolase RNA specificity domain-containing protein [Marinobacterium weihaiense]|uniref:MBL fold metallo-hydrolase n=1 Tax=Marinobacterium weihaiense TaxID=2851016 RepID=A0ABS6M7N3_9GAMM|nr:MBL fold metallo-hydrolase [Marinobacterium weihaiense]MBV0932288.1 MBL fold metallo-hydrolase [Marinobacterium weihaiense]